MSCSLVASLVTKFLNHISNYKILVWSIMYMGTYMVTQKYGCYWFSNTVCSTFVSWLFLFGWAMNHCREIIFIFILIQLLIKQTLTGAHHYLAGHKWRKCHELSGKCVCGVCGDRSELAPPPLRAFTWMSVECEENVFYHTAAPPSIALTSSSDENVTAAGTYSREGASKWAYAARDKHR